MLLALSLKNYTIIDDLSVSFSSGLNIITGETGAGKSVIVDSINIILGDKTSPDYIKSGEDEAHIEAMFDISSDPGLIVKLTDSGFEVPNGELLIKRVIYRKARSRVFINGSLSTLNILSDITRGLVDIFSQHEHQSLMREENHVRVLDDFAGLRDEVTAFGEAYKNLTTIKRELNTLEHSQQEYVEKEDYLKYQLNEIDEASLIPGEDVLLEQDKLMLLNSERLITAAKSSYEIMYEKDPSVLGSLKSISDDLLDAAKIDRTLGDIHQLIEKGIVQIEESAYMLRDYSSETVFQSGKLEEIDDRIQTINALKRKHGESIEEIIEKREDINKELENIGSLENKIKTLRSEKDTLQNKLLDQAKAISKKRISSSRKLCTLIENELKHVGIKGAIFNIEFDHKELSSNGIDDLSFLFTANPDEEPKPLDRVASGGELSRIMLVIKEAIAKVEGGSVIIFDEADSGIGGAVAENVGEKIKKLSSTHQVLCITHLPQVAKFADSHLSVIKSLEKGKTRVQINNLEEEQRVQEMARMIGGINITQKTMDAAQEMLNAE